MEDSLLNAISQAQEGILSELIDTGLQNSHSQKGKWGLAGNGEVKKCVCGGEGVIYHSNRTKL